MNRRPFCLLSQMVFWSPEVKIGRRTGMLICLAIFVSFFALPDGYAYGPAGHEMVGAIADNRLQDTPIKEKVSALLDGLTLAQAATLPDVIKAWDTKPKAKLKPLNGHRKIEQQLQAFFKANAAPWDGAEGEPRHHIFHYTDVPVEAQSYAAGQKGRNENDLVHMISYCMKVLAGKETETNPRGITKPIALILLTHYVGDLHQPLHVGAQYFDSSNEPKAVNGDEVEETLPDAGGNSLTLRLLETKANARLPRLHAFWDGQAVDAAKAKIADEQFDTATDATDDAIAAKLATVEPPEWKPSSLENPETWAEMWANESLALARTAHSKIDFGSLVKGDFHGITVATGEVAEKPDTQSYEVWAGEVTASQLHKAGWRLAFVIEKLLR
jgi:hypothetical protein